MGGGGSTYDYGFRIYNPQLGKFLSVDPLFKSFPWYTPYQFAGNKPIAAIDLDGLEEYIVTYKIVDGKRVQLSKTNSRDAIEVNYSFIKSVLENTSEYIVGGDVSQFYENGMAPTTGVLTITIAEDGTPTLHYKYEAPKYDQGYGQTDGGNASRSHFKSTAKTRGPVDDIPLGSGGDSPAKLTFLNFVDRVSQIFQELLSPSGGSEVNEPVINTSPKEAPVSPRQHDDYWPKPSSLPSMRPDAIAGGGNEIGDDLYESRSHMPDGTIIRDTFDLRKE